MKDVKNTIPVDREPTVSKGSTYLSMWMLGVLAVLVWWGFSFVEAKSGNYHPKVYAPYASTNELASLIPKDPTGVAIAQGALVYATYCANCHQGNGMGAPGIAPPLAGSEWVTAAGANRLVRIPLKGLSGPIKVLGQDYNMNMLAIGADMSDEQVANVLTYIRNAWGNKGSLVTPEQVAKVRAEVKGRDAQYTADELLKLPDAL